MPIEILSQEVQNQIAAGEVVERPAHLVKELIENSFDAGATKIEINFSEGGRKVSLTDNGFGISKNDLPKSVMRFATSKINETEDLWKLSTYGFRGEALASIAAVSNLKIRSKAKSETDSYQMRFQFGQASDVEQTQSDYGTSLHIDNLFENVPARLKFLKTAAAEHTQIKNTIKAMALSHFHVEFRVLENNDLIYFWPSCSSKKERVEQVLGIKSLYEGYSERDNVKVFSVMASPDDVQKTSKNIWLFAQNRWIQDRSLQVAVLEAYRNLLMHGEYPQAVVWVEIAPDEIDVNIHPTKSQVKFKDPSLVFREVQGSLRRTLEKAPWLESRATSRTDTNNVQQSVENYSLLQDQKTFLNQEQKAFEFTSPSQYQQKSWIRSVESNPAPTKIADHHQEYTPLGPWSGLQVIGQVNLTYIVTQDDKKMLLIDQHAAHERVAFEKLMSSWKLGKFETQDFLFPLSLELPLDRLEALLSESENLRKMGVDIERLGPQNVGIRSGPAFLKDSALLTTLEKLSLEIVENGGSFSFDKKIADIFASMACHSVVRAGQSLSLEEMRSLLQDMDQFPLSSYCPHGRPVSLEFNFQQLEKDFGRRV